MKASVEQGSPRMLIGYHNSHEQFSPRRLLNLAQQAEQAGFQGLFSSDHFLPWGTQQGESGFSFAWLGAAMQATRLPARVICCPFGRYHPTIVAQAAATLAEMFEDRFALALGSGQALNEHVTGERWPIKSVRMQRLRESVDVIRRLWAGETVTHHGSIVVEEAKLYSRPAKAPPLIGAAVTKESAASMGSWFDGLVTTSREPSEARELVQAFRAGGGQGKCLLLKVGLSYARTEEQALRQAHEQWRNASFPNHVLTEIRTPEQFDALGKHVRPEDMRQSLRISADPARHIEWLKADLALGFDEIYLHNVGPNQEEFITDFGRHVLPNL
jgi:coenzyme F420-dependent glucose-6-phosphate dehydrogenase